MHHYLENWAKIPPTDALGVFFFFLLSGVCTRLSLFLQQLLDAKFADANVRKYAVDCLQSLSDDLLISFLLQLVQVSFL
jgi:hypothetical protein